MEKEWREILKLLPKFAPHHILVQEYCEQFGVSPLRIRAKKFLRLLTELDALYQAGRFKYRKIVYEISHPGIVEALKTVCNRHFDDPLENHNYLKKVMIGIAKEEEKKRSLEREKALKAKERQLMMRDRDQITDEQEPVPAGRETVRAQIQALYQRIGK